MTTPSKTVAQVLETRHAEVLETWLRNIRALAGTRTLALMTEQELRSQASDLLRTLTAAFQSGSYDDITVPQFADSVTRSGESSSSTRRPR